MANFGTIRKVLAILGIFAQLGYELFSFFFYWPAMWYMDGVTEYVGGLYSYCGRLKALGGDWTCDDVTEEVAKSWDHDWAAYGAGKAFSILAELVAFITLILFYVHICVKNKIIGIVTCITALVQWFFVLLACGICSGTFDEIRDTETDPAFGLILVWFSWIICFGSVAFAVGTLVCIIKDKPAVQAA